MTEHVPGMAAAIERRATQRGLTPTRFADLAGLTEPGLSPVRHGVRKQYAAKTRRGVAVALAWPVDWYERILMGDDPDEFPDTEHHDAPRTLEERVAALERDITELRDVLDAALAGQPPAEPGP